MLKGATGEAASCAAYAFVKLINIFGFEIVKTNFKVIWFKTSNVF
jgi:multisubunit Na+/H+ antiporter MnhE subunit